MNISIKKKKIKIRNKIFTTKLFSSLIILLKNKLIRNNWKTIWILYIKMVTIKTIII